MSRKLTVAFSTHRPETLPFAAEIMDGHEAICLEEPPAPTLQEMLEGRLSIDDYVDSGEFAFPAFTRLACGLLRRLRHEGKTILQLDPYLEQLSQVHDFFSNGGRPEELPPPARVYQVEKKCTQALIDYYEASAGTDFERVIATVKTFARADGARTRLRDGLRAEAIAAELPHYRSLYVEAGHIHCSMLMELRRLLASGVVLEARYVMEPLVRELAGTRHVFGPGDVLTDRYALRPDYEGESTSLLAARSLVQVKILEMEEITDSAGDCPRTRDEVWAAGMTRRLSYSDCKRLYLDIRGLSTADAKRAVERYVGR